MTDDITPRANPVPDFIPVPRRSKRHDGWTTARQRAFIAALADTGSVTAAAAAVGKSPEGAYALRRAPGAMSFEKAWEAALGDGVRRLAAIAYSRAVDGVPIPLMHGGKQVGERRTFSDRLLTFLLRHHDLEKYGALPGLRPGTKGQSRLAQDSGGLSDEQRADELAEARQRIAGRVRAARDNFLRSIARDPKRRAAWDRLCPKADWKAARAAPGDPAYDRPLLGAAIDAEPPRMVAPHNIIPLANGWLPEIADPAVEIDADPLIAALKSAAASHPDFDADEEAAEPIDWAEAAATIRAAWAHNAAQDAAGAAQPAPSGGHAGEQQS